MHVLEVMLFLALTQGNYDLHYSGIIVFILDGIVKSLMYSKFKKKLSMVNATLMRQK